jgi:hypothetical protein
MKRAVRDDRAAGSAPGDARDRRHVFDRGELREPQRRLFWLADEHAVHGLRAQHRRRGSRRRVRPEAEERRPVTRFERSDRRDVGVERRRRAREQHQRRVETFLVELRDQIGDRSTLGRQIHQTDLAAGVAQHRGEQRQRVRRLGGAEDLLALLAAALPREGDAVHERRVYEKCLPAKPGLSSVGHQLCTTVIGIARRFGRSAVATAGTGSSSTLQQRRHTGKMPCSRRRRRIST